MRNARFRGSIARRDTAGQQRQHLLHSHYCRFETVGVGWRVHRAVAAAAADDGRDDGRIAAAAVPVPLETTPTYSRMQGGGYDRFFRGLGFRVHYSLQDEHSGAYGCVWI